MLRHSHIGLPKQHNSFSWLKTKWKHNEGYFLYHSNRTKKLFANFKGIWIASNKIAKHTVSHWTMSLTEDQELKIRTHGQFWERSAVNVGVECWSQKTPAVVWPPISSHSHTLCTQGRSWGLGVARLVWCHPASQEQRWDKNWGVQTQLWVLSTTPCWQFSALLAA